MSYFWYNWCADYRNVLFKYYVLDKQIHVSRKRIYACINPHNDCFIFVYEKLCIYHDIYLQFTVKKNHQKFCILYIPRNQEKFCGILGRSYRYNSKYRPWILIFIAYCSYFTIHYNHCLLGFYERLCRISKHRQIYGRSFSWIRRQSNFWSRIIKIRKTTQNQHWVVFFL